MKLLQQLEYHCKHLVVIFGTDAAEHIASIKVAIYTQHAQIRIAVMLADLASVQVMGHDNHVFLAHKEKTFAHYYK
jgi:hypothetical protein